MRIAFILPGRANSGGIRVISTIATGLRNRGHEVRLFCQRPSLANWCRSVHSKLLGAQDWLSQFPGRTGTFDDIGKCRFREDEVIVGVGMTMSYQLRLLAPLPNAKVQYLHGATPWDPELMQKALAVPLPKIVVASYLKEMVTCQGAGEILGVVHNGVDSSEYFASLPEVQRDGVGTIYSSHPAKDPGTVLQLVETLRTARPKVPFRIFGGARRPSHIPSASYSRFPSVRCAREIYSRSQVWVLASRSEGFPAPVLEAMACGCAVVATDCGGPRDIIADGENGFLVSVGDIRAMLDRVGRLLDDDPLRERMRRNGMETVKRFGWSKALDQLENVLKELLDSTRAGGNYQ